jgi:hypothetical protein
MSIVVAGVGELCTVDVFPIVASEPKGPAVCAFRLPAGSVWEVHADEQEAAWPQDIQIVADRADDCIEVKITVSPPNDFLLICYLRYGADQRTVRVRAHEGIRVLLDGQPRHELVGYRLDQPGGPERDPSFRRLDNG